jgi:hypothetical protein
VSLQTILLWLYTCSESLAAAIYALTYNHIAVVRCDKSTDPCHGYDCGGKNKGNCLTTAFAGRKSPIGEAECDCSPGDLGDDPGDNCQKSVCSDTHSPSYYPDTCVALEKALPAVADTPALKNVCTCKLNTQTRGTKVTEVNGKRCHTFSCEVDYGTTCAVTDHACTSPFMVHVLKKESNCYDCEKLCPREGTFLSSECSVCAGAKSKVPALDQPDIGTASTAQRPAGCAASTSGTCQASCYGWRQAQCVSSQCQCSETMCSWDGETCCDNDQVLMGRTCSSCPDGQSQEGNSCVPNLSRVGLSTCAALCETGGSVTCPSISGSCVCDPNSEQPIKTAARMVGSSEECYQCVETCAAENTKKVTCGGCGCDEASRFPYHRFVQKTKDGKSCYQCAAGNWCETGGSVTCPSISGSCVCDPNSEQPIKTAARMEGSSEECYQCVKTCAAEDTKMVTCSGCGCDEASRFPYHRFVQKTKDGKSCYQCAADNW